MAVLVVAVALVVGALALVVLVRDSLHDGVVTSAEQRASSLADQVDGSGLPPKPQGDDSTDLDSPEDEVWQIADADGSVVRTSQRLDRPLPLTNTDEVTLAGSDDDYVVATQRSGEYLISVADSLAQVHDTTDALLPLLLIGVPLLLLLVGGTTWMVANRALAPVERIRREVEQITGDRLERRVPEPASSDEIRRLAATMNQMLARLEASRDRQREFVADASHELRSPLASIRQTAEVVQAHPDALPESELATTVLEEGARMQRLVEQLLLLTRADEGAVARQPRDVDLDDLVLSEARKVRRPGLVVDVSGVGSGRVRGDQAALEQVVRNLLDNAARHASGRVTLAVANTDDGVELVVEDDGPGVPERDRERVFERFVRLDEARARDDGGSGLGLAIVREIVHAHGGSVSISDAATGGARFVVRLPGGTIGA